MHIETKQDQDILFYAFRYALGRKSSVVDTTVSVLISNWDELPASYKHKIKMEIKRDARNVDIVTEYYVEQWQKILELK